MKKFTPPPTKFSGNAAKPPVSAVQLKPAFPIRNQPPVGNGRLPVAPPLHKGPLVPSRPAIQTKRNAPCGCPPPAWSGNVVQRMQQGPKWSFGSSNDDISNNQWFNGARSTTFSTLIDDDGNSGFFKNNKSVTFGAEHAEDVWLRNVQDEVNNGKYSYNGENQVILNVTASPCTSTARMVNGTLLPATSNKPIGCTERLITFLNNGLNDGRGWNYRFQLSIICEHLYRPQIVNAREASMAALEALGQAGALYSVER